MSSQRYLETTYRNGRPFSAYYYLPRVGNETVAVSRLSGNLVIDFAADGRPIGIEMPGVVDTTAAELRVALAAAGMPQAAEDELRPLQLPRVV